MTVDDAILTSRHRPRALNVFRRQTPLNIDQVFSKMTEMVYVLKKHPNQSYSLLSSQLTAQKYSIPSV